MRTTVVGTEESERLASLMVQLVVGVLAFAAVDVALRAWRGWDAKLERSQ